MANEKSEMINEYYLQRAKLNRAITNESEYFSRIVKNENRGSSKFSRKKMVTPNGIIKRIKDLQVKRRKIQSKIDKALIKSLTNDLQYITLWKTK